MTTTYTPPQAFPQRSDLTAIELKSYHALKFDYQSQTWEYMGYTDPGTLTIPLVLRGVTKAVDQVDSPIAVAKNRAFGVDPITCTLSANSIDTATKKLLNDLLPVFGANNVNGAMYGAGQMNRDVFEKAYGLAFVPTENMSGGIITDFSGCYYFWFCYPAYDSAMNIVSNKDDFQGLAVSWNVYPNLDVPGNRMFGVFGNIMAGYNDAPLGVSFHWGQPQAPYRSLADLELEVGDIVDVAAYEWYGATVGQAGVIDNSGGYNSSATSLAIDVTGASVVLSPGDVIKIGTGSELFYVESYSAGVITVAPRGRICGTAAAVIADTDPVYKMYLYNHPVSQSTRAAWASNDPLDVTVGNVTFGLTNNRKGRLRAVDTGGANITCTVSNDAGNATTASPALVVVVN
jgi:hypothetical protein